jgi:MOSC domain-containing protein YiiM
VLRPGIVPVAGPIRVIERDPSGVSVLRAHRALLPELTDRAEVEAVVGVHALATSWREALVERLERL